MPTLSRGADDARTFHQQWQGPFQIVKRVTEVTYLIKKDGGRSKRSSVVHFNNNLRLYKRNLVEDAEGQKRAIAGCKSLQEKNLEEMNEEWAQDSQDSEAP